MKNFRRLSVIELLEQKRLLAADTCEHELSDESPTAELAFVAGDQVQASAKSSGPSLLLETTSTESEIETDDESEEETDEGEHEEEEIEESEEEEESDESDDEEDEDESDESDEDESDDDQDESDEEDDEEDDDEGETNLLAKLTGTTSATGTADFESEQEGSTTERELTVEVQSAVAGSMHNVVVGGVTVGRITIGSNGRGSLKLSNDADRDDDELPLPANFPAITANTTITVGSILSGTFAATPNASALVQSSAQNAPLFPAELAVALGAKSFSAASASRAEPLMAQTTTIDADAVDLLLAAIQSDRRAEDDLGLDSPTDDSNASSTEDLDDAYDALGVDDLRPLL